MKRMLTLLAGGSVGFLLGSMAGRDPANRVQQLTAEGWRALPRDDNGRLIVHPKALVDASTDVVDSTVERSPDARPNDSGKAASMSSGDGMEGSNARTGFEQFPATGLIG
jgi:hypothetical protein